MGNINTYALPQMKALLADTNNAKDAVYLTWLKQAVPEVENKLGAGLSVTVTGSSYALTPAPTAASGLWNVLAHCAVWLYHKDELRNFLRSMEGLASVRDVVLTMNRGPTMREMRMMVDDDKKAYKSARIAYARAVESTTVDMEEIGLRETDV